MKQEKIWEYFQGEGIDNFAGAEHRLYYLFSLVKKYNNKLKVNILNIGSGSGYFEKLCVEVGWNIHTLDIDKNAKEKLAKYEVNVHINSIESIPVSDSYFDFVVCSEVLEHLTDDQLKNAIPELYRVTKTNGYIIGTTPNSEKLFENITVCPSCNHKYHRWGHWQSFTQIDISRIFNETNFRKIKTKIRVFKDFSEISFPNYIKYFIRFFISKLSPSYIYSNILFIAKK
jgi:2-polyprenyl-3-methyl-5-hydroxy-6-metoxy-1,4-benzoquinol methylase